MIIFRPLVISNERARGESLQDTPTARPLSGPAFKVNLRAGLVGRLIRPHFPRHFASPSVLARVPAVRNLPLHNTFLRQIARPRPFGVAGSAQRKTSRGYPRK